MLDQIGNHCHADRISKDSVGFGAPILESCTAASSLFLPMKPVTTSFPGQCQQWAETGHTDFQTAVIKNQ